SIRRRDVRVAFERRGAARRGVCAAGSVVHLFELDRRRSPSIGAADGDAVGTKLVLFDSPVVPSFGTQTAGLEVPSSMLVCTTRSVGLVKVAWVAQQSPTTLNSDSVQACAKPR